MTAVLYVPDRGRNAGIHMRASRASRQCHSIFYAQYCCAQLKDLLHRLQVWLGAIRDGPCGLQTGCKVMFGGSVDVDTLVGKPQQVAEALSTRYRGLSYGMEDVCLHCGIKKNNRQVTVVSCRDARISPPAIFLNSKQSQSTK